MAVPEVADLIEVVFQTIKIFEGEASNRVMHDEIAEALQLSDKELQAMENSRMTVLESRLARARSYLKSYGLIERSDHGIWILTKRGGEFRSYADYRSSLSSSNQGDNNLASEVASSTEKYDNQVEEVSTETTRPQPTMTKQVDDDTRALVAVPPKRRSSPVTIRRQRQVFTLSDVVNAAKEVFLPSMPFYSSPTKKHNR